ncbi:MAG: 50S ribosomal protein L3 [Patescibacteria group bacterium]|nr:50S ribosomal protein L3 [Patescibacteria group bacterium]MCL5095574.1 50S ribosomal protein L3 [Patescibacteria group bacterium]
MTTKIIGRKLTQTQNFTEDGKRIPVTLIAVDNQEKLDEILQIGDKVKVTGLSKGKGFAGVVKRWRFAGGPRTHGQSDRERAPGSIGQTTTPGRVYKGKRMAGRMGKDRITVRGLKIVAIDNEQKILTIKGLIPGNKKGKVTIVKL